MSLSPAHLTKLKTNLKLSIERLKLLHSKKTSQTKAAAREIGELLRQGKRESARIRVENIIREDYLMEALEIMEIYCDVLLTRFGLIESLRRLDPAIEEAVHTVIYAAPRLADVRELMVIRDLLIVKFGKDVGIVASENRYETVSSKIVTKLQLQTPPLSLVQSYLIQIAKQYNIPFEPDPIDAIEEFDFGDVAGDLNPPNMVGAGEVAASRGSAGHGRMDTGPPYAGIDNGTSTPPTGSARLGPGPGAPPPLPPSPGQGPQYGDFSVPLPPGSPVTRKQTSGPTYPYVSSGSLEGPQGNGSGAAGFGTQGGDPDYESLLRRFEALKRG